MRIDSLIEDVRSRFNNLTAKNKRLAVYLGIFILFWFYFSIFLKPNINKISDLKKQNRQARKQLDSLVAQFPDPQKAEEQLKDFNKEIIEIKTRTKEIESKLLGVQSAPQLLKELIKDAQGKKIDFQSVKQVIEPDKSGFSKLSIELEFDSTYKDMLIYLATIEGISSLVKVEGIELAQAKSDPANLVSVSLKLSALLSSVSQEQTGLSLSEKQEPRAIELKRSPLMPSIKMSKAGKKLKGIKLTGITYRKTAGGSSAIINDTVVKVGDEIEGYKVADISPESVIITDGMDNENLAIER